MRKSIWRGSFSRLGALRIIFRKKLVFRYSLGDCGYKISGLLSFLVWLGRGVTHTQTSNMDGHIRVKIGISPTDRLLALQGFGIFEQILTRHKKLLTLYYSIFVRVWDVINEEENGIESFSHTLQDYNYLWYIVGRGFCSLRSKLCLKCFSNIFMHQNKKNVPDIARKPSATRSIFHFCDTYKVKKVSSFFQNYKVSSFFPFSFFLSYEVSTFFPISNFLTIF